MDGADRKAAAQFDFDAAGVPPELGGFGNGNGGEDIEFGVDQADWQIAQADDKDIEAKQRKRAIQAAADIGFDERMREQGDGARVRRAQAMMELRIARADEENRGGKTDFRMQFGPRNVQGNVNIPFLNPIAVNDGRLEEDPFLVGKRGRDGNLEQIARKRFIDKDGNDRGERIKRMMGFKDKKGKPQMPQKAFMEREPNFAGVGNQQAIIDAQIRVIGAVRRGEVSVQEAAPVLQQLNAQASPAGGRGVAAKNPALEADRRAAAEARVIDAARFDPGLQELQNRKAAREAQGLGVRFNHVNDMNNIPNIRDVGNIKVKLPFKAGGFNEGQFFPQAVQDGVAPAYNASGIPLGINPPTSVNSPTVDNALNAPRDAREWLVQNQPGFKEGGRVFGDFPQVDIMGAGNDFLGRIAKIKAKGQAFDPGISAIRNINDLDAVVQNFAGFAQEGGLKMFALDADKKEVFRDQVGLPEIFQKMKMNENAQGRLANAMFQLEIGRANGVNVPQRAAFELGDDAFNARKRFMDLGGLEPAAQVQFGARLPEFGNDEAQLQKIPRGAIEVPVDAAGNPVPRLNIGVDAVGEPIEQEKMAALQALSGRQAQPPLDANELRDARNGLVGLVQGEGRGRNYGFAKKLPDGAEPRAFFREQAIERAKPGKQPNFARVRENADAWQRIVDREKAARNAPNQVLGVVGSAERELQAKGANFPAPPVRGIGEVRPEEWRRDPDLVQLPDQVIMSPEAVAKRKAFGRNVVAQAEGGGMGGGTRPPSVVAAASPDPWQTPPATGGGISQERERRMSNSMLNQLAELNSGPTQGPLRAPRQGPTQGPKRERSFEERRDFAVNKIKGYATSPRHQRGRRVGYGVGGAVAGIAGLDALIGGERDNRDQEVYQ